MGRHRARALIAVLLGAAILSGCGRETAKPKAAEPFPAAATIAVALEKVRREQVWDGVVEAVNEATMSAQTSGRVLEIPFDVNDYVPAGSVIIRLTDVEQQAALRQARASADEAQRSFDRIAKLRETGTATKAAYDQALARRDTTAGALRTAQQHLAYTVVKAPYSGYVTKRFVQVGEEVQPGTKLIAGISLVALRVEVAVPQSAAGAIRQFSHAEILLTEDGSRRVQAAKVIVFPYADRATHSFAVRLELPQADTGLFPGMTVKVAFAVGEAERLMVPASALVQRSEVSGVYVVSSEGVALRQLRLGHAQGDRFEVTSGLAAGERIAANPDSAAHYLSRVRQGGS